jgi:LysM repeat protein
MRARQRIAFSYVVILTLLVTMTATALAAPGSGEGIHIVQAGETLLAIAQRYGVSVEAIMQANGLVNRSLIRAGQQLVIPSATLAGAVPAGEEHVIQPGETLYAIAGRYGLAASELARANGIANPALVRPGQLLAIPASALQAAAPAATAISHQGNPNVAGGELTQVYVVQAGDTLAAIAQRTGSSVTAIAAANRLSNPGQLRIGQPLAIPEESATTAVPATRGLSVSVSISQQRCQVFQHEQLLYDWPCSTGQGITGTRTGTFYVQSKIREAWGSAWGFTMPYWLGIYWSGGIENGIHGLPYEPGGPPIWSDSVGTPVTFGCVLLGAEESQTLWNMAYIGMPVTITY